MLVQLRANRAATGVLIAMKWMLVFLLITPPFAFGQAVTASNEHSPDEQAIMKLQDTWLKAFDAGDADAMDKIEAEDFTVAGEFGQVTKAQQLDGVRKRTQKAQEVTRATDGRQFRFYGEVAVLTETDHATTAAEGQSDFQTTEVWVKRGDSWQVVHLHFSALPKKP